MLININCPNCGRRGINFKGVYTKKERVGEFKCKRCNWFKLVTPETPIEVKSKEEKKDEISEK